MSETADLGERLARHLAGVTSEAEREALERQALEDDPLFDQLEALESELVDAYVRGELGHQEGRGVARLLEVSSRTRALADTSLALVTRQGEVGNPAPAAAGESHEESAVAAGPSKTSGAGGRAAVVLVVLVLLVLAGLGWGLAHQRGVARALATENVALRREFSAQEERLVRLEEANRTMVLRLARLEAQARP